MVGPPDSTGPKWDGVGSVVLFTKYWSPDEEDFVMNHSRG